ncbi:MAG: bacillithiol system redox-active protein YtxJ [Bacteroidetes bacterium]|nr:bacillithiol system redox-active protein YtxJ [Bacteroidota bacterium]MBS1650350.1 bacillithiol system redox-active protein YtxJ [Bacteroidota bacterium]
MNWIPLTTIEQLQCIKELSFSKPQIIFKHSTRCSISKMALNRLEKFETPAGADFYYLDLITYRNISNAVAEIFDVYHESPQAIIIKNGTCVYNESHSGINMEEIMQEAFSTN